MLGMYANVLGDVISAMRTSWIHWRLNAVRVRAFSGSQPVSYYQAGHTTGSDLAIGLGYVAVDTTKFTSTPSWNSATQFPNWVCGPAKGCSLTVPKSELRKTTVPWFETTSTSSESEAFQCAGSLWYGTYAATATTTGYIIHLVIEGEVEFRDRIDNSVALLTQSMSQSDEKKEDDFDDAPILPVPVAPVDVCIEPAQRSVDQPRDIDPRVSTVAPRKPDGSYAQLSSVTNVRGNSAPRATSAAAHTLTAMARLPP